jgi:8-oxo-dGTP pyrophosphatase MutT (NUDIX family)
MSNNNQPRKVFNFDNFAESKITSNNKEHYPNSISAGGCLFYKRNKQGEIELLLIKYKDPGWPRLDDLGGQIDKTDETILDAIIREASEETNHVITKNMMHNLLLKNYTQTFYNKKAKYFMLFIEVDDDFFPDTSVFGDLEVEDNIERTIKWYKYQDIKSELAYRLSLNENLVKFLEK